MLLTFFTKQNYVHDEKIKNILSSKTFMKKIASGVIFIPSAYINYEWSLNYVPTSHSIVPKSLSIEKGLLLIQHFTHHQFDSLTDSVMMVMVKTLTLTLMMVMTLTLTLMMFSAVNVSDN